MGEYPSCNPAILIPGDEFMMITLIRTVLLYIFVVLAMRIMGKRQIGELQPSELVVTLLISDIAAVPMQEIGIPLVDGIVPIFVLVSLELILSACMIKSNKFRQMISGKPVIVVRNGKVQQNEMRRIRFTIEDLMEGMRLHDVFRLDEIAWAIVETNGQLSILKKPELLQPTAQQLNIPTDDPGLPMVVVSDGDVYDEALKIVGFDVNWLNKTLKEQNVKLEDIFIMTTDRAQNFQIVKRRQKNETGMDRHFSPIRHSGLVLPEP